MGKRHGSSSSSYYDLVYSARSELNEAKQKKKKSLIWLIVYFVLFTAGLIFWNTTEAAVLGWMEFTALIGYGLFFIVLASVAFSIYGRVHDKLLEEFGSYLTPSEYLFRVFVSLLVTFLIMAFSMALVADIFWECVEGLEFLQSLHAWLTTPIRSIFQYRGWRVLGCIFAVVPVLLLSNRFLNARKEIAHWTQVYAKAQTDYMVNLNEEARLEEERQNALNHNNQT